MSGTDPVPYHCSDQNLTCNNSCGSFSKEFDPDEFYQLLEEAEGQMREQLPPGIAIPDLPQYIVGKLGLDRSESPPPASSARRALPRHSWCESMMSSTDSGMQPFSSDDVPYADEFAKGNAGSGSAAESAATAQLFAGRTPGEDDFEAIKARQSPLRFCSERNGRVESSRRFRFS